MKNTKSKAEVILFISFLLFLAFTIFSMIINCKTVSSAENYMDTATKDYSDFWKDNETEYSFIKACIDNADSIWDVRSTSRGYAIEMKDGSVKEFYPAGSMSSKQVLNIAYFVENCAISGSKFSDLTSDPDNPVILVHDSFDFACFKNWHIPFTPEYQNYFNSYDDSNVESPMIEFKYVRLITRHQCVPYIQVRETDVMIPLADTESIFESLSANEINEVTAIMQSINFEIPSYLNPLENKTRGLFLPQKSPLFTADF